jgi:hypothetical protein
MDEPTSLHRPGLISHQPPMRLRRTLVHEHGPSAIGYRLSAIFMLAAHAAAPHTGA